MGSGLDKEDDPDPREIMNLDQNKGSGGLLICQIILERPTTCFRWALLAPVQLPLPKTYQGDEGTIAR